MMFAEGISLGTDMVDLAGVAKWLVILGFLLGIYLKLRSWEKGVKGEADRREVGPQPFAIKLEERFTTRDSFHKHAELNRQAHEKLELRISAVERQHQEDKDEIIAAGEDRATKIHDRINVLVGAVGELTGEIRAGRRGQR